MRVFRRTGGAPSGSLMAHFRDLYLDHPAAGDDLRSLVYEHDGRPAGFIGSLPLGMRMNGEKIRAVIGGNYMIDPDLNNPFAGVRILKAFLEGPQDLAMTDTANETGRAMWEGLNGVTLSSYSMQWLRVLRPARFASSLAGRRPLLSFLGTVARPLAAGLDVFASRVRPFRPHPSGLEARALDQPTLMRCVREFSSGRALAPEYTEEALAWVLGMAGTKTEFGPMRSAVLYAGGGTPVGWYLYYIGTANKPAQVLQFMARPGYVGPALSQLFLDAFRSGSFAVIGRVDPQFVRDLFTQGCLFGHLGIYVEASSRRPDIIAALTAGNAFLTRLEGEWWTKFQGDTFED